MAGGHAWQGGYVRGRGAYMVGECMAGGRAWQGACVVGGCLVGGMHGRSMHGGGHTWQGGHAWQGGIHGRYYEIR